MQETVTRNQRPTALARLQHLWQALFPVRPSGVAAVAEAEVARDGRQDLERILSVALEQHDAGTGVHSRRVARLATLLGQKLGLSRDRSQALGLAALLHDIGKLFLSDHILLKPGPLTDTEWEEMKQHPTHGYAILQQTDELSFVAEAVYSHHERYDGSGYPRGLEGEAIPVEARACAVVDAYDAMTSDRPYRRALPHEAAIEELQRCAGSQFDPRMVDAFRSLPRSVLTHNFAAVS